MAGATDRISESSFFAFVPSTAIAQPSRGMSILKPDLRFSRRRPARGRMRRVVYDDGQVSSARSIWAAGGGFQAAINQVFQGARARVVLGSGTCFGGPEGDRVASCLLVLGGNR